MNELEVRDALACLIMLERDAEWWDEQGLSRVRPTLRDAWKAMRQLQEENKLLHKRISELEKEAQA
jgi:hypothetical protein